ncbi:MAG: PEP-CTERM sorting domain-containing protein [Pirellulales bacterium]
MKRSKQWMHYACIATGILAACVGTARAGIIINEIGIDLPGTDNGQEFFELKSTTNGVESLSGLHLLSIEGDGASAGTIDQAISLGSFSTGTNGLFLWRDAATVLSPAPHPATVVNVADFSPDLENGSNTFVLVSGFSGAVGNDLDTNDDGMLDSTPWTSVVDSIGLAENDGAANRFYLGTGFAANPTFNPDALIRLSDGSWFAADVTGASPGPYAFDPAETENLSGAAVSIATFDITTLTPGNVNPIPEPTTALLLGLATLAVAAGRRRAR